MKKIYLFAAIAALFAVACTTDDSRDVEGLPIVEDQIFVSFEDQSDTRIQLNEAQKTVWTKDDMVSVFYRSNGNQKWQYQGETGEREGVLKRVAYTEGSQELSDIVVVYPYNENYYINPKTGNVQAYLPAVQTYIKESYGIDGNIMVSQSEYNQVSLKSVCGWLKIQLTGNGEKVQSIKINGNNGEQVAGEIYINSADATSVLASEMGKADDNENGVGGNLVFEDTILTEVTLNCSQGVTLSSEVTAFYIALPPQKFEKGLTMEILTNSGYLTKSTDNEIVINRNAIRPMEKCEFIVSKPKHNEIWYTNGSTTEATTTAYMTQPNAFGEASIQSNTYDTTKDCWVITFDKDLTTIGYSVFCECSNLTSVTIPDSVTKIEVGAFSGCSSLASVIIPDSVTEIGQSAFYGCSNLTSVTIGDSVTTIGNDAFSNCKSLTSVTIPDSVTKIGRYVFSSCSSLASVIIGDSVTKIEIFAFYRCSSLTSVTIGNSVTTIGNDAFRECSSLTSVTIPDSVTIIGPDAFYRCSSLTSVTIGNSVTTIGQSAFFDCSSLTSVIIPDSVTTIGNIAFDKCNNLTDVTIGKSVTTIGGSAFKRCYNLQNVYILAETPPTLGSSVFPTHKFSISVPDVALEKYLESDWREYILQPFVDVEMVNISASDAIVGWSVTNWKDYATDFANAWTIVLKKGNDLVVSWNIPANSDIWSNYAYKGCRFILTGLDADTEYTVSVKDVSTGHTSDTLTFKTEASKVVTMPETTANPGDVILYEDFSDLFITADISRGAAGYSYDYRNLMDSKEWIAKGDDPVANDVDGRGCYLVDPSVEVGMFNTIKKYIATTRLNTWGMMSEEDTKGAICARAGYVKIGASAKCAWLVTPEINCVQQYAKVKLSFDAAVHDAYPEDTSNGLDPNSIIVELLNGCTQLSNAENSFVRPSNRIPVSTLNLTDTWTRYTIDIDNIKNGDRIAIGGNRNGVPGQHRFYLDNIEIKVVSYGDLKLSAPKIIEIIPSYTNAKVTWDKVNIAEQYVVEYANSSSPSLWTTLPATTETEATIEGLAFDTEYSVRIKAIVGNVESMFCEPVTFKTLPKFNQIASPKVVVTPGLGWFWIDVTHVPMATGYEVYKDGVKIDAVLVSTSETNTVYRVDANLPLDTDFSYEVKSVAEGYEPSKPVAVTGKTAKIWQNTDNVGPTTLSISWTDLIPGGTNDKRAYAVQVATDEAMTNLVYDIYCRDGQGASGVTSFSATSWFGKSGGSNLTAPTGITVGQLQAETTYYFRVKTVALGDVKTNGVSMNFPMGASNWSPVFSCKTEAKHVADAKEVIFQGFDDITMQMDFINYTAGTTPLISSKKDVENPHNFVTEDHWCVYPGTTSHLLATWGYAEKAPFVNGEEKYTADSPGNYVATAKAGSLEGWHMSDSISPHQGYIKIGAGSEKYNYISTPALNSALLSAEGTLCTFSFKACSVVTDEPVVAVEVGHAGTFTEVKEIKLPMACTSYTDRNNYEWDGKWTTYTADVTLAPGDNVIIRCKSKRFLIDDIQIVVK